MKVSGLTSHPRPHYTHIYVVPKFFEMNVLEGAISPLNKGPSLHGRKQWFDAKFRL